MSLSFVSSSVLSSTDGVSHDQETPVEETKETRAFLEGKNRYGSLYDQLRTNQQQADEEAEEISKSLRGTRALDDEDVAHLNAISNQQKERLQRNQAEESMQLALFKAARAERSNITLNDVEQEEEELRTTIDTGDPPLNSTISSSSSSNRPSIPMIIKKKKRKKEEQQQKAPTLPMNEEKCGIQTKKTKSTDEQNITNTKNKTQQNNVALGGLLGCYDSDEDSDSS